MLYVALAQAALILILLAVLHSLDRANRAERREWTVERRELLNRIQAPDRIPADPVVTFPDPEPQIDLSALVGSVEWSDPLDNDEEEG